MWANWCTSAAKIPPTAVGSVALSSDDAALYVQLSPK
jgi:hypothetical protein